MNRDTIVNYLILFYGVVAGVCAILLVCGLVFGWVIVPEQAQAEFWRLVILILVTAAPLITNELRNRQSRHLEQKVDRTLHEVANGLPKRIVEELQPARNPSDRTRSGDTEELAHDATAADAQAAPFDIHDHDHSGDRAAGLS